MSDIALYNKYVDEMCIKCKNRTTELCEIRITQEIGFVTKDGSYKETYKKAKCVYYDDEEN